jgi:hypothetical protein
MEGHVVIYLGKQDGIHQILHGTPGYYIHRDGSREYIRANGVVITPLEIHSSSGAAYPDMMRKAVFISTLGIKK